MAKYNILVLASDAFGCGKYRSIDPHFMLMKMYPELFNCQIILNSNLTSHVYELPEFIKQFDLIHIHKQLDNDGAMISTLKFLGKKVIVDVDDHYVLGPTHPMHLMAKKENWAQRIITHLQYADLVTTTTPIYQKILLKTNRNVEVIPNAIPTFQKQFIDNTVPSERLRIGIVCGSSHLHDIQLLDGMFSKFSKEDLDKLQFVLCGFDTRGTKHVMKIDGTTEKVPIEPIESVWYDYEKILTNNYSVVSDEYKKFLHEFIPNAEYPNVENEVYRRCWTKPIDVYATHYNNIDVLLAPLVENEFNSVKSQLKVLEAGFFHKAIIASNFGPYTLDLKNALTKSNEIVPQGNALLVDKNKNDWGKYIKLLLDNRDLLTQLQENLYNTVKDTYSLEKVTELRKETYLKLLEK